MTGGSGLRLTLLYFQGAMGTRMSTSKVKMDEFELMRRAQEPGQRAGDRAKHAVTYAKAQMAKDNETSARIAKLREMRLAAEAAAPPAAPDVKTVPGKRGASKATASKTPGVEIAGKRKS